MLQETAVNPGARRAASRVGRQGRRVRRTLSRFRRCGGGHGRRWPVESRPSGVQPLSDVPTLECVLVDGSGEAITLVFLGRRSISGLQSGSMLIAEGMVGKHRGKLAMINPAFELAVPGGIRAWSTDMTQVVRPPEIARVIERDPALLDLARRRGRADRRRPALGAQPRAPRTGRRRTGVGRGHRGHRLVRGTVVRQPSPHSSRPRPSTSC